MKKQLFILLTSIMCINTYAQISYEKGYFINNSGEPTICLIKNADWYKNPTKFKYKFSEYGVPITATIDSVKAFGIHNKLKYERFKVNIDRSSDIDQFMSDVKEPIFKKEKLFLKVLVEGKANLYSYTDDNLIRYFFKTGNTDVEQLIYKKFKTSVRRRPEIAENNQYRTQLWNNLLCENITIDKINNTNYHAEDLVKIFLENNKCGNSGSINYRDPKNFADSGNSRDSREGKNETNSFNLTLRPGLNSSSLSIYIGESNPTDTDFDTEIGFRFGIEAEYIMPFNKNKWSVIFEPTYQYYKSEKELRFQSVKAEYKSIDLPIGIRHYFFLNDNSKIFVNGLLVPNLSFSSKIDFEHNSNLEIKPISNLAFGLGFNHNNKYSLEVRYGSGRDLLKNTYRFWESDYNSLSIIFGYTIF